MHDEATCHYTAMVDQTALGHQFLRDEFNVTPRIGWQIDPFGHSATQGSLLSTGVGFDALYFARIDYEDYRKRIHNKDLEFLWRPSKSRGKAWQVFTGQIQGFYTAPAHFLFERDTPIQDDPNLHDFNVCSEVEMFVKECLKRAQWTKGNHIFLPMGEDFAYSDAIKWFKNMDKLMHYTNQDGRVNVLYSNLSYYTDLKREENITWSVKTDDFFPYGSNDHDYWSGFFSSRPSVKKFSRVTNSLLQQLRQLDAVYQSHHSADLVSLTEAVGLVQHHDGITGTEKQAVADDYEMRLYDGVVQAEKSLNEVLFVIGEKEPWRLCLRVNASVCNTSTTNEDFELLVHNSLPRTVMRTISVPVASNSVSITPLSEGVKIRKKLIHRSLPVHNDGEEAPFILSFSVELLPLQLSLFKLHQAMRERKTVSNKLELDITSHDMLSRSDILENDFVLVEFDWRSGSPVSILNKRKHVKIPLSISIEYYRSHQDPKSHPSGAYVFHPESNTTYPIANHGAIDVKRIDISSQGSQNGSRIAFSIGKWAEVQYKLADDDEFLEVEWTVGPIPIDDKVGKEVIVRIDTNQTLKSNSTWYSDSNGLEFVKRVRSHRDTWNLTIHDDEEFVAANYVPITTSVYMKDDHHQLNVVTDRAQGAASLKDGQIEIMVHRRLLADDQKGVDESLNETESYEAKGMDRVTEGLKVRGSLFIGLDDSSDGIVSLRSKVEREFYSPLIAFRKQPHGVTQSKTLVPWLRVKDFPLNVGLTTLIELSKKCVMVRLTHLFAVNEHQKWSKPVTIDFKDLFFASKAHLVDVQERSLTGVWAKTTTHQSRAWKADDDNADEQLYEPKPLEGSRVELQAMEVRTFHLCFKEQSDRTDVEPLKYEMEPISDVLAFE